MSHQERAVAVPRISDKRAERYWKNWTANIWGKTLVNHDWKAECFICDVSGVLGVDLIYRGPTRPRNLICNKCFEKKGNPWLRQR